MQFIDLKTQQSLIKKNVLKRINSVLEHGQYIMGPEIKLKIRRVNNESFIKDINSL